MKWDQMFDPIRSAIVANCDFLSDVQIALLPSFSFVVHRSGFYIGDLITSFLRYEIISMRGEKNKIRD